jgi:hypothetical protein
VINSRSSSIMRLYIQAAKLLGGGEAEGRRISLLARARGVADVAAG